MISDKYKKLKGNDKTVPSVPVLINKPESGHQEKHIKPCRL